MSKKQDFIRSEPSRDQEPERAEGKGSPADFQQPGTGKVANDHNKMGNTEPTQKNEGERTPESRSDRESQVGSHNQVSARKGGGGGGRGAG